jgi:cytochrome c peroxidase
MLFIFGQFNFMPEAFKLKIPAGFPDPLIPEGNPLTKASVELGRELFFDTFMSRDSSVSCASCHHPHRAFTDGLSRSRGIKDREVGRNAPGLANVVYQTEGLLHDKGVPTLEMQILVPVQEHNEFDFNLLLIAERMKNNPLYVKLSKEAYNLEPNPYVITRSIANFERTILSGNSRYDQFINGDDDALSESEKAGMNLFMNELKCTACHSGFLFSDFSLRNNALYTNAYPLDSGRMRLTHKEVDRDLFKVPGLRNIEVTGPYMHDGSFHTLGEVIDHYQSGGKSHPNKSKEIQAFVLNEQEKTNLIDFLKSLTDDEFLRNPEYTMQVRQ